MLYKLVHPVFWCPSLCGIAVERSARRRRVTSNGKCHGEMKGRRKAGIKDAARRGEVRRAEENGGLRGMRW